MLEGSIGTLAELFLAWNLLAVDGRPQAPLVCLGRPWAEFVRGLGAPGLVVPDMFRFVEVVATPEEAVRRFRGALVAPSPGG